jgi:serine protease
MCRAPDGTDQVQCYCSVGLCGAGMLDAAGAVQAAASATLARIAQDSAAPAVGDTLRLSGAGSLPGDGRRIVGYAWSLVSNPGVVAGFSGATDVADVELQVIGEGTLTVNLVVTDDAGASASVSRSVVVGATGITLPVDGSGGGGGGASSLLWVALLGLGVVALQWDRWLGRRRAAR